MFSPCFRRILGFHVTMLGLGFLAVVSVCVVTVESRCSRGCDLALASYYVWDGSTVSFIGKVMNVGYAEIASYNPDKIPNQHYVQVGARINIPFRCDCINNEFLGRVVSYSVRSGDTYERIATLYYSNLTTAAWVQKFNSYGASSIPENATVNVTVNCSCGDSTVSEDYGLFITYPLRTGETLESVASAANLSSDLVSSYNRNANFSAGSGLVYIPGKHRCLAFFTIGSVLSRLSGGVIASISIAGVAGALILAICIYFGIYKKKKAEDKLLPSAAEDHLLQGAGDSTGIPPGASPGITVDKSLEFSYEELALATDNFNIANKIGQGGFGSVYYAELRGENSLLANDCPHVKGWNRTKDVLTAVGGELIVCGSDHPTRIYHLPSLSWKEAAIKKMDMQASKEFLAELKVLTHVHHLTLVRLIGYCVERSLCLVYEYIENGNLSQHLRGSGREALPWSTRVQIALDSARGLEYIHEHTVPVYIHHDIKSANILIDKNFHGKVADFGLTKLTDIGSTSLPTRLVGTFGYMSPEYAQYGDVSPKLDVYAFGVVLYELISAEEAIVKPTDSMADSKGLVGLFEEVLSQPDPIEDLAKLVDPRLGDGYPLDAVLKMAQLAKACTQENPQIRPSMRSIVVALMTLSSSTDLWDVDSFSKNQALVNLMSGR